MPVNAPTGSGAGLEQHPGRNAERGAADPVSLHAVHGRKQQEAAADDHHHRGKNHSGRTSDAP
ncbi:hypothetical protein LP419_02135 [Massilia sp. H-1]|nr:hypothetical protein LP419_02135 [Massilia sp. H-1]